MTYGHSVTALCVMLEEMNRVFASLKENETMKHHTDLLTPEEDAAIESPSADHSGRCLKDQQIRAIQCGGRQKYEIAHRPKRGPDLWQLMGTTLTFTAADIVVRENLK